MKLVTTFKILHRARVFNRGSASVAFLWEMIEWARTADDSIFAPNSETDIYAKVKPILGPFDSLLHRRAIMLEVMRVLAGFESSWDWAEGVDTSRLGSDTPENSEAGAWQVSYDARAFAPELRALCVANGVLDGVKFQQTTKFNHPFAMEFVARLMRYTTKHNGPLYKGEERLAIRKSLRGAQHSIYPWLRQDTVAEFSTLLS